MKINVEVDVFKHDLLCNLQNKWCRFMHLDMARECILFDKKLEAYKEIWMEKCEPCKKAYKEVIENKNNKGWYCPECKEHVEGRHVTYEEYHDVCGCKVL